MELKNLRISWRQLLAEPAYSVVVVLGLAIAIAATYLIALLLTERWLPDPAVPAPQQVVRLELKINIPGRTDDWLDAAPFVFRDALLQAKAPISQAARIKVEDLSLRAGERISKVLVAFTDPDLAPMFGIKALQGDVQATLQRPDGVVLSTRAAERLFGPKRQDLIGQRLRLRGEELSVGAIVAPQAANSELDFDALVSFDAPLSGMRQSGLSKAWYRIGGRVFVRLNDGASAAQLGQQLQDLFDHSPGTLDTPPDWSAGGRKAAFVRAIALTRLPFDGAGSAVPLLLCSALSAVAVIMLAMAAINYVNLSSVRTLRRQREIAVRKSLGAGPAQLALQFIAEACLVALLAGAAGLLLAWLLAPSFFDLLGLELGSKLFAPARLLSLVAGCLALGVLTGAYPARVALGVHCAPALQGRKQSEGAGGRSLRRAMTVLQFGAALTLSGAAIVVVWQSEYMAQLDLGFKTAGLLAIDMPRTAKREQAEGLYEALKSQPGVQALSWSNDVPGRNPLGFVSAFGNGSIHTAVRSGNVDLNFFKTYQIPLLAGTLDGVGPDQLNQQGLDSPLVLDLTAVQALGFASAQAALGQALTLEEGPKNVFRVVAVVGHIKQQTARHGLQPQSFWLSKRVRDVLTLKGSDSAALRAAVAAVWPRYFPDDIVDLNDVTERLAQRYRLDRNIGRLIAATSLVALALAGFGVYALAAYTVRRAALEIVIRKLHGAGHRHIAALLAKEFAPLLGLAALFSLPLVWWIGQQYLAGFVERAEMGGWPLLAALAGTLAVTGLASLRHGLAALAMRPVWALRD